MTYDSTDTIVPERTFMVDRDTDTVVVPAGRYYLGDPCYTVQDTEWLPWLEAADYMNEPTLLYGLTTEGLPVFAFGTAYGDGAYRGSDGFTYGVDAGLIGLVPVEHTDDHNPRLVTIVEFDTPTQCQRTEDGVLFFGDVRINTAGGW